MRAETDLDLIAFRILIDRVVVPARRHFRQLFLPVAVPLALAGLLLAVIQAGWFQGALGGAETFPDLGLMFGGMLLMVTVFAAAYGLGFSALMVASTDAVAGRTVSMWRAWLFPLRPAVLATLIIVAVADFLAVMMCFLPALYVVPVLTFVLPVMVEERRFGFAAIRRSVELVHSNPTGRWSDSVWLQTLALLTIGMVINYAVTITAQLPFLVVQQILVFREVAAGGAGDPASLMAGMMWLQVPAQILSAFATAAAWLYWTFGVAMLYREVRRRNEAEDLQRAIGEITGALEAGR